MADFTIRRAREDELATIKKMSVGQTLLELDEFELQEKKRVEKEDAERLEVFFRKEGNEFFVAEDGAGRMAGYVWFGVSQRPFSGIGIGWIYDIEVVPEHRGKGVGEMLMRHALDVAKGHGFRQTGLMVNAKNRAAWSLYEKLGFKTEHMIMTRTDL